MSIGETMAAREKAAAFLRFITRDEKPKLGSPWEVVQDSLDARPAEAWKIILWAVALSRNDEELSYIGTGPLEHLLVHHGEYLDRVLPLAGRHSKVLDALRSADVRGGAPEDVARLDAFLEDIERAK